MQRQIERETRSSFEEERRCTRRAEFVTLPSGQRVFALASRACDVASLPTSALRPEHFSAHPEEVQDWATLTKSALQRALGEVRWDKLRAERNRRRDAAPRAPVPAPKRLRDEEPPTDDAPPPPLIVVDCAFDALMTPPERASLAQQLAHCYAAVKRESRATCALMLVGLGDACVAQLQRISGVGAWRATATQAPLARVFPCAAGDGGGGAGGAAPAPEGCGIGAAPCAATCARFYSRERRSVTYLTADSPHVLWHLERGHAYVVGGLVDRNRHKGASASAAAGAGLCTARLPIAECGALSNGAASVRKARVLTTNRAVEALAAFAAATHGGGGGGEAEPSARTRAAWQRALTGGGAHDEEESPPAVSF